MTFQVLIADNITVGLTDRGPTTSRLNWPIRWITRVSNTIDWRDTTHLNSENDYHRGCRNVSHWQQHFYSGQRSPRRPCSIYFMKWLLQLGPVVRRPISANPGQNFNTGFFFFCSKAFFRIILSILFRASNHQIVDKKNKTEFAF